METYDSVTRCPYCRKEHNLATLLDEDGGGAPDPDSIMLCVRCGEVSIFAPDAPGGLRKPTDEERLEIELDESVTKTRQAWEAMVKATGGVP